jgi:hypothetical protein
LSSASSGAPGSCSGPGVNVIKLFLLDTRVPDKQAGTFVLGEDFMPIVVFEGETGLLLPGNTN